MKERAQLANIAFKKSRGKSLGEMERLVAKTYVVRMILEGYIKQESEESLRDAVVSISDSMIKMIKNNG
jgi:hypothetical protein